MLYIQNCIVVPATIIFVIGNANFVKIAQPAW